MHRTTSDMHAGLRLTGRRAWLIAGIGILSLAAYAQSASPGNGTTHASESVLSRNAVVPLTVVNRFFSGVTKEASTGRNLTAVGKTKATRSVIYISKDSSKKVTITVDQYASSSEASSAYQEAVQKSKNVAGFKAVSARSLGQNAFIGAVTQGKETHIGLGALQGTLIVGVTLVGYDPTVGNIDKLVSLTREEEAAAEAALDRTAHH